MQNLLKVVQSTTQSLAKKQKQSFNTNDWLLANLLNKEVDRQEAINMLIVARIEHANIKAEELSKPELEQLIKQLYKTSKNGLDTSVSDSNNNSSFSYNQKYADYKLIKRNNMLSIIKR